METIWKYPVPLEDDFTIEMPQDARILCIQIQDHKAMLWALVSPSNPLRQRRFVTCGTGRSLSVPQSCLVYISTYQQMLGALVWHIFEVV